MKVFSSHQVRRADIYTIKNEPIKSIDLMERASKACFNWLSENIDLKENHFVFFCGLGNNGGDGLAIARMLSENKADVSVYIINFSNKKSSDFEINENRLLACKNVRLKNIYENEKLPEISVNDIVVDAILGSGLSKTVEGFDIMEIEEITPESKVEVLTSKIVDSKKLGSAVASIIKLTAIHLFYKLKWGTTTLSDLLDTLNKDPVQEFARNFDTLSAYLQEMENTLKKKGYNVQVFATGDLLKDVFKLYEVPYKSKYGQRLSKEGLDIRWSKTGVGAGTCLERYVALNKTIMDTTESINAYNKGALWWDDVTVWKGVKDKTDLPFVIFYYWDGGDKGCGVIVDLSFDKTFIKAERINRSSDAPVMITFSDFYYKRPVVI